MWAVDGDVVDMTENGGDRQSSDGPCCPMNSLETGIGESDLT
jgi:hypothetical protein